MGGTAMTFTADPVYVPVDRWIGVPNFSMAVVNACGTLFCPLFLAALLLWRYPPQLAWQRIRLMSAIVSTLLVVQIVLFSLLDVPREVPWRFDLTYGPDPLTGTYILVVYVPMGIAEVIASRLLWTYASVTDATWPRRGLRCAAVGCAVVAGFPLTKVGYVVAAWYGRRLEWLDPVGGLFVVLGASTITLMSMVTWGPWLSAALAWMDRWHIYRELYPLWAAVTNRFPHLVLDGRRPAGPRADAWAVRHLKFRLVRRYVEIRDGLRALRPFQSDRDAATAHAEAEARGLTGERLQALVEASRINGALRRQNPVQSSPSACRSETPGAPPGGANLHAELLWLVQVARELRHAPGTAPVDENSVASEQLQV
jgi:hypothetical protein